MYKLGPDGLYNSTTQNDPPKGTPGGHKGHSIFYFMKIEGSKPAICEWMEKLWLGDLKEDSKDFQKDDKTRLKGL